MTENEQNTLVFSHLNFELLTLVLSKKELLRDTFFLTPTNLDLREVEVVVKSKSWVRTRRLRQFKDAFLGTSRENKHVKILNPEILIFSKKKKTLRATAAEPLKIENRELGYQITFYLEKFELDIVKDDVFYKGNAYFEPIKGSKKELARYKRNRRKIYQKTSRFFFAELVKNEVKREDYFVGFSDINYQREFIHYEPTSLDSIKIEVVEKNKYSIKTRGFFTVTCNNKKIKKKVLASSVSLNSTTKIKGAKPNSDNNLTSYLNSKTNQIIVNQYGIILNSLEIVEYGYWANLRIGSLLPLDYEKSERIMK